MSKSLTTSNEPKSDPRSHLRGLDEVLRIILPIGFHLGLFLIAIALIWEFFLEPSKTAYGQQYCLWIFCVGSALSGIAWVASSKLPRMVKPALMIFLLLATIWGGLISTRELSSYRQILRPGRIERNHFVHDGLGLSFRIVPGMQLLRDVIVTDTFGEVVDSSKQPRLRFGQEETLFRMALPEDTDAKACPIVLKVKPFRFSRRDVVVYQVLNNQTEFSSQPGSRLVRPLRFRRIGKLDLIEFELAHTTEHFLSRYVFLRSGAYLLCFILRSPNLEDRRLFDEFISSIQIKGQATRFDQ